MDAIHLLNFTTDSTISLIKEAQRRGFSVYCYRPEEMFMANSKIYARCSGIKITDSEYTLSTAVTVCLDEFDVILMRQDPPFNINYITATYLLEKVSPKTIIVNNPAAVRNSPEKLLICDYPEFMPPTLITQDLANAEEFFVQYKQVVIKPLHAFGGIDVSLVDNIQELRKIFSQILEKYGTYLVVQKFLPEVRLGDKRIILINGKPVGAINRIPATSSIKANLAAGATAHATVITKRELEICEVVGDELKRRGIVIAGIDVIGDYITEINVTCPTGFNAINRLYDLQGDKTIEALAWDGILR